MTDEIDSKAESEGADRRLPADTEDLSGSLRSFIAEDRVQLFLIGFLVAIAFFLVEAGIAEVLLSRNESCMEALSSFRLSPDPNQVCMSEFGFHLVRALSMGPASTFSPEASNLLIWSLLAVVYGLVGGGFAQLSPRNAIVGYAILHLILLMIFTSTGYISQFIVR